MNKYIGTKMIEAEPMTKGVYNESRGRAVPGDPNDAGYLVKYQDGYESWSPKEVFDKAYMKVDDNTELPSGVSIGQKMVDEFIAYTETKTMGTKTTVVRCVLRNGFEIVRINRMRGREKLYRRESDMKSAWVKSKIRFGSC
ncbi:MAG: Gp49 family protein [Clostridium sp.]